MNSYYNVSMKSFEWVELSWMTNHGYLRGGSYECNYNESMGTFVSMKSFERVHLYP